MKTTMTKAIGAALLGMTLFCNDAAWAGYLTGYEVYIGSTYASGSINAVRHSSDNRQYIGCRIRRSPSNRYIQCHARDRNGNTKACTANATNLVEVLKEMSPLSHLAFFVDDHGRCSEIDIYNYSYYLE